MRVNYLCNNVANIIFTVLHYSTILYTRSTCTMPKSLVSTKTCNSTPYFDTPQNAMLIWSQKKDENHSLNCNTINCFSLHAYLTSATHYLKRVICHSIKMLHYSWVSFKSEFLFLVLRFAMLKTGLKHF